MPAPTFSENTYTSTFLIETRISSVRHSSIDQEYMLRARTIRDWPIYDAHVHGKIFKTLDVTRDTLTSRSNMHVTGTYNTAASALTAFLVSIL